MPKTKRPKQVALQPGGERTGEQQHTSGRSDGDGDKPRPEGKVSALCLYCGFFDLRKCVCVEPANDEADLRKKLIARRLVAEGNFGINPFGFAKEQEVIAKIDQHL